MSATSEFELSEMKTIGGRSKQSQTREKKKKSHLKRAETAGVVGGGHTCTLGVEIESD